MTKNYISPEITLIKLHTETVMGNLSGVSMKDYKGEVIQNSDINISTDIKSWDGSDIETAKDNGGNDLWDNED